MVLIKFSNKQILINQRGSALVYTITIFSVIFILSMSVLAMFSNNLFQAKHQENRMEAYYLSYSGALMAFSAITQDSNELLNEITNNKRIYKQEEIELGQGTIDIQARKYNDLPYEGWVEITSVSSLNNGKISTTNILYVDPDNQNNIKWKSF